MDANPGPLRFPRYWDGSAYVPRLLNWLYERLYHELAGSYDLVSWLISGGRWRAWQRSVLPFLIGPRVLEVGCGPGHLLVDLLDAGFIAYGVDRSPTMWRLADRRLTRHVGARRVIGADTRSLPFPTAAFDSLVWTFPTGVARDPAFWREAARVVRPGGRVALAEAAVSNTRIWPGLLERVLARLTGGNGTVEAGEEAVRIEGMARARRIVQQTSAGTVWLVVAEVGEKLEG